MARSRNIKPGFFVNEVLSELEPLTRLLFIGLWTIADREGRLEDRPKRIKISCLPYDQVNIESCLDQLQTNGFIRRFSVENCGYIEIINWRRHQSPHHKEVESVIPAPPKEAETKQGVAHACAKHDSSINHDQANKNASCPTDSLNLILDSLNLTSSSSVDEAVAVETYKTRKGKSLTGEQLNCFNIFWDAFDYRKGKAEAADTWIDLKVNKSVFDEIINGAKNAAAERAGLLADGRTPKMAQGWLSSRRWEDEVSQNNPGKRDGLDLGGGNIA